MFPTFGEEKIRERKRTLNTLPPTMMNLRRVVAQVPRNLRSVESRRNFSFPTGKESHGPNLTARWFGVPSMAIGRHRHDLVGRFSPERFSTMFKFQIRNYNSSKVPNPEDVFKKIARTRISQLLALLSRTFPFLSKIIVLIVNAGSSVFSRVMNYIAGEKIYVSKVFDSKNAIVNLASLITGILVWFRVEIFEFLKKKFEFPPVAVAIDPRLERLLQAKESAARFNALELQSSLMLSRIILLEKNLTELTFDTLIQFQELRTFFTERIKKLHEDLRPRSKRSKDGK